MRGRAVMTQGKASAMDQLGLGHGLHKESFVLCDKIKVKMTKLGWTSPCTSSIRPSRRDCRTVAHVLLRHTYAYIRIYRQPKRQMNDPVLWMSRRAC
ncbi:hypothetical protein D5086_003476 [Populus alba]|uniref:Uncharacterized protein n=1 Tax=Populus alba TaxID=43335 RepID=A0ACC4D6Q8_POPAL